MLFEFCMDILLGSGGGGGDLRISVGRISLVFFCYFSVEYRFCARGYFDDICCYGLHPGLHLYFSCIRIEFWFLSKMNRLSQSVSLYHVLKASFAGLMLTRLSCVN